MQKNFIKWRKDQNCLIWVFLGWNSKKLLCCGILHLHSQIFKTKFRSKIKIFKFGTKIALAGYFGLEFQKLVLFEISIFEFVNMQSFIQKKKTLNLGPKIPYSCIFGLKFNKNHYQIFNQYLWIRQIINFHPKRKKIMVNLGP